MINIDIVYILRQIQLQKVIGELNALKVCYYNPNGQERENYNNVEKLINNMICDLESNLG